MYKIVTQLDNVGPANYFEMASAQHNHATRQGAAIEAPLSHENNVPVPTKNLVVQNGRLDLRRNFFTHCVINDWNKLKPSVKNATSLNELKNAYDTMQV